MDTACGPATPTDVPLSRYRHEAFFYRGFEEFMDGSLGFIGEAIERDEPVMVVVSAPKIEALRRGLNGSPDSVIFADMADVGANPGRIIAAWQDFLSDRSVPVRQLHGIGEPIWAERTPAELDECQHHEALLNGAFSEHDFRLMCPYDASALNDSILAEALRTHPLIYGAGHSEPSSTYAGTLALYSTSRRPLPAPPEGATALAFSDHEDLQTVRRFVTLGATKVGLRPNQIDDLVLAANELATNSLRYGEGHGSVKAWGTPGAFILEFSDSGRIEEPMIGRLRPDATGHGGRGVWLANQLCDLVQIRAFDTGNVVRVHSYIT